MNILDGLNAEQRMAVEHTDGPLLVVAGAGTGKTQVITRRIAYLIAQGKAKPGEVLALTFTDKAAREMEDRLYELIGWESFQVPVMTFHAFGADLLGRFASHIGRSIRGGLLNDVQKALLLNQQIHQVKLEYYGPQTDTLEFLEGIVAYIGNLQNAAISIDQYEEHVARLRQNSGEMHPKDIDEQEDLAKLFRLYESIKLETGTFDYNDQLHLPLEILRARPNLAQRLGAQYKYVLVDEYQDTNAVQDELLRTFIRPEGNLFAVGDDDQAIYGFRGAEIGNILAFAERYRLEKPVVLVQNYRSGQAVLDAAYRLIRHNDPERLESKLGINKRLVAQHNDSKVEYMPYLTSSDEQQGVLSAIAKRISNGEKASGIAVLAATHAPLKALAKQMRTQNVPFALSTSVNIFEQPELIGLWYLLKWLCWQADEEAIGHVIMGSFIGWDSNSYRAVLETAREEQISVEAALRQSDNEQAKTLVSQLDSWRKLAGIDPVSQLVFKLVFEETDSADKWRLRAASSPRMVRVFEDLQRLIAQMQDYETVAIDTTAQAYMKVFPKPPALEVSEPMGDAEGVQLLTVHASKGLEFEAVYLVGCNHRSWVSGRGLGRTVPEDLKVNVVLPPEHEFRRLMYVAVTRARRELVISASLQTAGGTKQAISPFVDELFPDGSSRPQPAAPLSNHLDDAMTKLQRYYPMAEAYKEDILPFEDSEGWFDLSVTSLGRYEYCPFEFYLENVLQIKQPMGPQLTFGSVLHRVFETYYKAQLRGEDRVAQELHDLLDEFWEGKGYERKDLAEADRELAHTTLEAFLKRESQVNRAIIGSEIPIRFVVPEIKLRLRGKIDALFETPEGVELRDFKTGRTKTDVEKLSKAAKENFQLRSYALAYELLKGQAPAQVTLDYVVTGTEGTAVLSAAILRNHRVKLASLIGRIRARDFAPNVSPMHTCAAIRYYGTGEVDELFDTAVADSRTTQ